MVDDYALPYKAVKAIFRWTGQEETSVSEFFQDMIDSVQRNHGTLIGAFGFGDLISEKIASEFKEAFPGVVMRI